MNVTIDGFWLKMILNIDLLDDEKKVEIDEEKNTEKYGKRKERKLIKS